tara:strand:- start:11 stop:499 length:489 start_codon:yes stop_codon:yes gene_type:complete
VVGFGFFHVKNGEIFMTNFTSTLVNIQFGNKLLPAKRNVVLDTNGDYFVNVKGGLKSCTVKAVDLVYVDPNNHKELLKTDGRKATKADLGIAEDAVSAPVETKQEKPAKKSSKKEQSVDEAMAAFTFRSNMLIGKYKAALSRGEDGSAILAQIEKLRQEILA